MTALSSSALPLKVLNLVCLTEVTGSNPVEVHFFRASYAIISIAPQRKAVFACMANEITSGYLLLARNVQYKGDCK